MSDDRSIEVPLQTPADANAGTPPVPGTINTPDSPIRQAWWWQCYVRLARPTLDWITDAAVAWTMILQPALLARFDPTAAGMALAWAGTVYGFKFAEKVKGVA